jgi:hypothetical protein
MPVVPAGYLPSDTASHLVVPRPMGHMAALYALDICSGISGICGPLPERVAPGVVKEPADFFDDIVIVFYLWGGPRGDCCPAGGRVLNCWFDQSSGRQLAKWPDGQTWVTVRCEIRMGKLQ